MPNNDSYVPKSPQKRQVPGETSTEASILGGLGGMDIMSLIIQIGGGVIQGLLESQGITSDQIDAAFNFFNPERIQGDLLLLRRLLNLLMRFVSFFLRYLPIPSASNELGFLNYLTSKFAIYATEPTSDNVQLLGFNNLGGPGQLIQDLATQRPISPTVTEVINIASLLQSNLPTTTSTTTSTTTTTEKPKPVQIPSEDVRIYPPKGIAEKVAVPNHQYSLPLFQNHNYQAPLTKDQRRLAANRILAAYGLPLENRMAEDGLELETITGTSTAKPKNTTLPFEDSDVLGGLVNVQKDAKELSEASKESSSKKKDSTSARRAH